MHEAFSTVVGRWWCGVFVSLLGVIGPSGWAAEPNLLAHYTFDEEGQDCRDSAPGRFDGRAGAKLERIEGIFGKALRLSGNHHITLAKSVEFGGRTQLAFSVWAMPENLSSYREFYRKEDGDRRVLFSFQDHGKTLALGLNVGGYVECDARIDPKEAMDGQWHHCAATFDGKMMRVYFDGREIGSLARAGKIFSGGTAQACIASMNGSECFQGGLDDLRVYGEVLTPAQITALYESGRQQLDARQGISRELIESIVPAGETFAITLSRARRNMLVRDIKPGSGVPQIVVRRLKQAFGKELDEFSTVTGMTLLEFLTGRDGSACRKAGERVVELMLEYRPITPQQWARISADEKTKWSELDKMAIAFRGLGEKGDEGLASPRWIELVMEMGRQVQLRPYRSEAVAPYVRPETPVTQDLSPQQAREVLEKDWLHQADGDPTPARIAAEIGHTRQLAARMQNEFAAKIDLADELAAIDRIEQSTAKVKKSDRELYFQLRQLKRTIVFKNPLLDFDRVLFVDMPFPGGNEWNHETRHRLGYMALPGARLMVLKGLSPAGQLTQLMPKAPLHGAFWRPDVSFDAKRVLFCFKAHNEKSFHLYEINADGTGLRQITDGPFDDLDPIYLPDGKNIAFSTTRGHSYVRCMPPTNAYVLARCDLAGKEIFLISANNEPDYLPSVLNDGRMVYTRWEYTDKPLWRAQKLWSVNPDGTQVSTLWGNQSVWPDVVKDARAIPGSRRIMVTGSAHHNWFSGSVGLIDPDRGLNFPEGLTKITADVAWPECGNGPVDPIESAAYHRAGDYPAYYSPYPLSERDFLVSANRGGKFRLYLMDVDGNRELVYEGAHNIFHAIPLRARPVPPVIDDRVAWPTKETRESPADGVIFSANVYEGTPTEMHGKVRYLRVWHIDPKTYTYWFKRPYISTGPVVSVVQSEGVKRLLGTVPVERDGSVNFSAPSGKALHFQLLDENQRALQTMRSFVNVMPGEYRGCLGCHEAHTRAPEMHKPSPRFEGPKAPLALLRAPDPITPPPWTDVTVSYPRYVQPVFDRYCNNCHAGDKPAAKILDLSDKRGALDFAQAYHILTGHPTWGRAYKKPDKPMAGFGWADMLMVEGYGTTDPAGYRTPPPMTALSYKSRLIDLCANGKHYDTKVDSVSLQRLIAWVDAMCPYNGDEEIRQIPDPVFQGMEWLSIKPRIQSAPRIARPGPVE